MNEWLGKAIRVLAHAYYSSLSQANRAYSTLTRQLEAVIIEVSTVQALRLRTNSWQVHEAKYLPPTKVTYSHTCKIIQWLS